MAAVLDDEVSVEDADKITSHLTPDEKELVVRAVSLALRFGTPLPQAVVATYEHCMKEAEL